MTMQLVSTFDCREDAEAILWQLLLERPAIANISNEPGTVTLESHRNHVLYHPHREWCLIKVAHAWVGAIYITHHNELGIGILQHCQRQGYARRAIDMMMDRHPAKYYLANVAPGNYPSHRMWKSFTHHAIIQLSYRIERGENHAKANDEGGANPA